MNIETKTYYLANCESGLLEAFVCTGKKDPQYFKLKLLLDSHSMVELSRGNYLKLRTEQRKGLDIMPKLQIALDMQEELDSSTAAYARSLDRICCECFKTFEYILFSNEGDQDTCSHCLVLNSTQEALAFKNDPNSFNKLVEDCQNSDSKYEIIYADPAWKYKDQSKNRSGASKYYKVMSLDDIKEMPVAEICEKNAILFMWVTMPLLQEGLDVIKAWGFRYTTCGFNWFKRNKIKHNLFIGGGHYTRSNTELCLLGVRGKPLSRLSRSVRQAHVIDEGSIIPIQEHSKKPDVFAENIVTLFGEETKRIELFARDAKKGWDAWGNEVGHVLNSDKLEDDFSFLD